MIVAAEKSPKSAADETNKGARGLLVSGEASLKNDLRQSSTKFFLHGQSEASRLTARLQAPAAAAHRIRWHGRRVPRRGCRTDGRGALSRNGSDAPT